MLRTSALGMVSVALLVRTWITAAGRTTGWPARDPSRTHATLFSIAPRCPCVCKDAYRSSGVDAARRRRRPAGVGVGFDAPRVVVPQGSSTWGSCATGWRRRDRLLALCAERSPGLGRRGADTPDPSDRASHTQESGRPPRAGRRPPHLAARPGGRAPCRGGP